MVKPSRPQLYEEDEPDYYDSSSFRDGKAACGGGGGSGGSEQKSNSHRSKHSETEQRRRSKINERFQVLRNLIPQNDQKKDKASFLLEVIEYIQFLQEKLQIYEGSYQGWSQEPAKLVSWSNNNVPAANLIHHHSQVMKNGSATPEDTAMLTNIQNSMEPDFSAATMYKTLDHPPDSSTLEVQYAVPTQSTIFPAVERGSGHTRCMEEPMSDTENMAFHLQSQLWQDQPCSPSPKDAVDEQERMVTETESVNLSSAYSQGLLNTLTQAFRSSGVDLTETSISVQVDVGKRVQSGMNANAAASSSKVSIAHYEQERRYLNVQATGHTRNSSFMEESDYVHKRMRKERS